MELLIPSKLVGRDSESELLESVWHRVCEQNGPTETVLVHGVSGSGKTVFCRQLEAKQQRHHQKLLEEELSSEESQSIISSSATADVCRYFVSGKFDQYEYEYNSYSSSARSLGGGGNNYGNNKPFAAIISALDALGRAVHQSGRNAEQEAFEESLQAKETMVLRRRIPSFAGTSESANGDTDANNTTNSSSGFGDSERFAVAVRAFLKGFFSKQTNQKHRGRSLVLFMDDLQWCDKESFGLLKALMTDDALSSILVLGAFRTEGKKYNPALQEYHSSLMMMMVKQPQTRKPNVNHLTNSSSPKQLVVVSEVELVNLNLEMVQLFVGHILGEKEDTNTQDMTKVSSLLAPKIHSKTDGNPMSVLQYLTLLHRQRRLRLDDAGKWKQHQSGSENDSSDSFAAASHQDELVQMLTKRIQEYLPEHVQLLLKIASCMGYVFDIDILQDCFESFHPERNEGSTTAASTIRDSDSGSKSLSSAAGESTSEGTGFSGALHRAHQEGLIILPSPSSSASPRERIGKFEHDKVQQAAYELIGEALEDRMQWHRRIGRQILKRMPNNNDEEADDVRYLMLAAGQLNRAALLLRNPTTEQEEAERIELICLNLRAGKAARSKGGMVPMAGFLRHAVALIKETDWTSPYYETVLEIMTLSCEAEFSRGQFHRCHERRLEVERHARSLKDKIQVLVIQIQVHGVLREFSKAIMEARKVLALLDEKLPPSMTLSVIYEFVKAKKLASGKEDGDFLGLEPMSDWRKVVAMKLLRVASVYAWNRGDKAVAGICFLRLFIITVKHGYCEDTSYGFATFGMMLAATNDERQGVRFAKLALGNARRSGNPPTIVAVYVFLWHLENPFSMGLEPLLGGYRTGLEIGDMEFGSICYSAYVDLYVFCGLPLAPFINDVDNFGEQLRVCRQELPLSFVLPYYRMAMNLFGLTKDPLAVSWDSCREFSLFSENMTRYNDSRATMNLYHAQLFTAFILRDVPMQAKTLQDIRQLNKYELDGTHFSTYFYALCIGLAAIAMYREKRQRTYWHLANKMTKWIRQVSTRRSSECLGILRLLEAELQTVRRKNVDEQRIREIYDHSISLLARAGFTHFCAMACEQAGRFFKEDAHWSVVYIERAAVLYEEWGAMVKVQELGQEYSFIEPRRLKRNSSTVINIRGRERFNTDTDTVRKSGTSTRRGSR